MKLFLQSRYLRNVAALQVGGALTSGLNFLGGIGLAYVLGARGQGLWIVSNTLYSVVFLLASLGLMQVTVTQVAAASARGNVDKAGGWLAGLLKGYLGMGALVAVLGALLLPEAVAIWRRLNHDIDPRVATWATWLLLTPVLDAPRVVVLAGLQGTRRMARVAQVETAGETLRTFLVVAGAILSGSPSGPVVGTLIGTATASVVAIELYRRARGDQSGYALPSVREIVRNAGEIKFVEAYKHGFGFGVIRMTDALGMKLLPPLIVQTFGSTAWVAYFKVAQSIVQIPLMLMQGVGRTALPALAELRGVREHRRFRELFARTTWIGGSVISAGILAAVVAVPLVARILPPDYRTPVWTLCAILALACVPQAYTLALDSFYLLTSQLRVLLIISVAGIVLGTPISILLAATLPRTGAAWGVVVSASFAFLHLVYIRWYFRHDPELAA